MGRPPKNDEGVLRRARVYEMWLKGWSQQEIADKLDCQPHTIAADMEKIKAQLERKALRHLDYRKKKHLGRIDLIVKKAWEIFDNSEYKSPVTKLSAQRVVISALELGAKVDGLIAEKLTVDVDKEAAKHMKALRDIEAKAKADQGNGHKDSEEVSAELGS